MKKKKKGNWRNRFGPCFTTDVKPSEPAPSLTLPTSSTANTCSSTATPSSSSSSTLSNRPGLVCSSGLGVGVGGGGGGERGLGVMGVGGGIQKSPSLLRNGSLQSNSGSATTGLGEVDTSSQQTQRTTVFTTAMTLRSHDDKCFLKSSCRSVSDAFRKLSFKFALANRQNLWKIMDLDMAE